MSVLTATDHLNIALEYVEDSEAELRSKRTITFSEAQGLLTYLDKAARHLALARSLDDSAVLTIQNKSSCFTLTQNQFAAHLLIKEAQYCALISRVAEHELPTGWYPHDRVTGLAYLQQAVDALEKASRFYPQNSDCFAELAEIYKLLGDKPNAVAAARRALAIHSSNSDAIKLLDEADTKIFNPLWPVPSHAK